MKRLFHTFSDGSQFAAIVGNADEIKATYKKLLKRSDCGFYPVCLNFPKFNPDKLYGISFSEPENPSCYGELEFSIVGERVLSQIMFDMI
jgi:hypothetical protein